MTHVWFQDNTRPSLLYTVKAKGQPVDLVAAGFTVATFSMRPYGSDTPKVLLGLGEIVDDGTPGTRGQVRYDPQPGDVDTPGDYLGWFTLAAGTDTQDTPEFEVRVKSHAPDSLIVTTQELAQSLRLSGRAKTLTADEQELLEQLIVRATARVESYIKHRFAQETAATKTFGYFGDGLLDLAPWDLRGAPTIVALDTDLSAGGVVLDSWGWRLEPRSAPQGFYTHLAVAYGAPGRYQSNWWAEDRPIATALGRQISITGNWGWPSPLPEDLRGAILEVAQAAWQNPAGEALQNRGARSARWFGSGQVGGSEEFPQGVQSILDHYRRASL